MKKIFDDILKYWPIIGACLIFSGVCKMFVYYNHYNINIVDYLDFSEIITSFLDDIYSLIICLIIIVIYPLIMLILLGAVLKVINIFRKNKPFSTQVFSEAIEEKPFIGFTIGSVFCSFLHYEFLTTANAIYFYFSMFFELQLIMYFLAVVVSSNLAKLTKDQIGIISTLLWLVWFTYNTAQFDIKKNELESKSILLITNHGEILNTSNEIYIGKTNEYFFLHNTALYSNRIIPTKEVIEFTITEKKK